jgi:lactoylglutathione lyase
VRIEHVALWVRDLERMRGFYVDALGGRSGPEYVNPRTGFRSYFVSFDEGARIELMTGLPVSEPAAAPAFGYVHLALALGSRERVDALTAELRARGVRVTSEPRTTGDGYYESQVADPEGNRIELTV